MKGLCCALFLALFLFYAYGQAPARRLGGKWSREACDCGTNVTCDQLWDSEYDRTRLNAVTNIYLGFSTSSNRTWSFRVDPVTGMSTFTAATYTCQGWLGRAVQCFDATNTLQCSVTFTCLSGDCLITFLQQNMRSIMYPVMAGVIGVVWFAWPFIGGAVQPPLLVQALCGVLFLLSVFVLVAPTIYEAIVVMALSAFTFNAIRAGGSWEIKLAGFATIFVFLMLAGLNVIAGPLGTQSIFENTLASFNDQTCQSWYAAPATDERCGKYLLFVGFVGYLITLLLPLQLIGILWTLVQEEEAK